MIYNQLPSNTSDKKQLYRNQIRKYCGKVIYGSYLYDTALDSENKDLFEKTLNY